MVLANRNLVLQQNSVESKYGIMYVELLSQFFPWQTSTHLFLPNDP